MTEPMYAMRGVVMACLALALSACQPHAYCEDSCSLARDGECDDGRLGAATGICAPGTDCGDCGPNFDTGMPTRSRHEHGDYFGQPDRDRLSPNINRDCRDPEGWYCTEDRRSFYYTGQMGETGGPGLCVSTVTYSCGEGRHCADAGLSEAGTPIAVGCVLDGAILYTDRVVECEVEGYCDNDVELRWCSDYPVMFPIPTNWERTDVAYWYEMGSHRCQYQEPSDPVPQPDDCIGSVNWADWCVMNGGTRYCGATRCAPEDPPVVVSDECRSRIASLRFPSSGDSCIDSCTDQFIDCNYANNCQTLQTCTNRYTSCTTGCR